MKRTWSSTRANLQNNKGISPEVAILLSVTVSLDQFLLKDSTFSDTTAFLGSPRTIESYARAVANVVEIMPVGRSVIKGYQSWLYRVASPHHNGIWIAVEDGDHDYVSKPRISDWWREPNVFLLDYVTIIAHEVGHVARNHRGLEVATVPSLNPFPAMGISEEWEAWLFAEYFRAFILADHSAKSKQDRNVDSAPGLFLHRRCHADGKCTAGAGISTSTSRSSDRTGSCAFLKSVFSFGVGRKRH